MSGSLKILAFAGSARQGSFNQKLVKLSARGASSEGVAVTYLDLRDLPMPLFDEDLEAQKGLPETVLTFKALLKDHQGFLISCPEYNSSITPLLKNALDWASRPVPNEDPRPCFRDKVAALVATSPGALGGLRGLVHVRAILGNMGVFVLPDQKAIPGAHEAFDERGNLKDGKQQEALLEIGAKLARVVKKLSS
jgi:chromate reductase